MAYGLSRRSILKLSAAGIVAPWVSRAGAQSRQITMVGFSGIVEDRYKAAVTEPFTAATGIKVNYLGNPNSAASLGIVRAQKSDPQTDICMMDVVVAKAGGDEDLFVKLTEADMPIIKDLHPAAQIAGVPGPAVTFDSFVMLYSPNKFPKPPTSWRELWNPAHKGRIALQAPPDTLGVCMTLIADKLAGGADYTTSVQKGIELLGEMAPLVQTWDPKPDTVTVVTSGAADISSGWNARGQAYALQTPDRLAVCIPDEGSLFQINTINLVKRPSINKDALEFIKYALSPEPQARFTEALFYGATNRNAVVAPAAMEKTVSSKERLERTIMVDWLKVAELRNGITEQWRRNVINRS